MAHHYDDMNRVPAELLARFTTEQTRLRERLFKASKAAKFSGSTKEPEPEIITLEPLPGNEYLLEPLGATGRHPDGQLGEGDKGEFRYDVATSGDRVFLNFGTPVAVAGFTRRQAVELAKAILNATDTHGWD